MLFDTILLFLVFAPLIGGIILLVSGFRLRSSIRIIAGSICFCLFLLIIGLIIHGVMEFSRRISDHTDPRDYQLVLHELQGQDYNIEHFPLAIPADASHVRFYYQPHFLQGAMFLQLRYQISSQQIKLLYNHFTSLKHRIVHGDETPDLLFFETSDASQFPPGHHHIGKFPEDYEIVLLSPERYRMAHGVAISKKRNEIVYWAFGGGG